MKMPKKRAIDPEPAAERKSIDERKLSGEN